MTRRRSQFNVLFVRVNQDEIIRWLDKMPTEAEANHWLKENVNHAPRLHPGYYVTRETRDKMRRWMDGKMF